VENHKIAYSEQLVTYWDSNSNQVPHKYNLLRFKFKSSAP
jgi:hypothetical protein